LDRYLDTIKQAAVHANIQHLVLRFRRTRNPDVVAIEHLERFLHDAEAVGITVLLAGVRPDLAKILKNSGFSEWLASERVFLEEDEQYSATIRAVRTAYSLVGLVRANQQEPEEAFYYLI
jgi:SulP family sulfate permease